MNKVGVWLWLASLGFTACGGGVEHHGKTPLVEVDGMFLYREDVQTMLPLGVSEADSAVLVDNYVRSWIEDMLLYEKAEHNVGNDQRIRTMVENYRQALIKHEYQQMLINQQMAGEINDDELKTFYEANTGLFKADETLFKGLFIKVPLAAEGINRVRRWYKNKDRETIDKLEKYSLGRAVDYMYFYDRWLPASVVLAKIPLQVENADRHVEQKRHIEVCDSAYCYFLTVDEVLLHGEVKPFETAKEDVKKVMLNQRQTDFMRSVKEDLYRRASEDNDIIYYYDNTDEKTN